MVGRHCILHQFSLAEGRGSKDQMAGQLVCERAGRTRHGLLCFRAGERMIIKLTFYQKLKVKSKRERAACMQVTVLAWCILEGQENS